LSSTKRILSFDISLAQPGASVVEIKNGKATVVAVSHTKTNPKENYANRGSQIEHWAHLFAREHLGKGRRKGYDAILREAYAGRFGHHPIFSGWHSVERGLNYIGMDFTEKPIAQQSVKKTVVGKGRAEKEEVEEAVRKITGYTGEFSTSDESDSAAVALAFAINEGLITKEDK